MIDIHTHILPGVDDGARTVEESILMVEQAIDAGVDIICATPHILDNITPALGEKINRAFQLLRSRMKDKGWEVQLTLGSEIYLRQDMKALSKFNFFSLNQTGRYILLELPLGQFPFGVDQLVYDLQLEGITPIIAHPERSITQKNQIGEIENLIRMGALMQINAGSLLNHFGKPARKMAEWLLRSDLVHLVASDAHNPSVSSISLLSRGFRKVSKLTGEKKAERLFKHNPFSILQGEKITEKTKEAEKKVGLAEVGLSQKHT